MEFRFDRAICDSFRSIKENLLTILEGYKDLFPISRDSKILLKPNLNSNMNALTGNTTDLRLMSAIIQILKDKGYSNILIGEGTNSGFYRNRIGVISRLRINNLAEYYGVKVKDFNYAEPCEIEFENNVKASVAKEALEADLFINLPKLKTHFENGMSVCLKNLMGCLIGQENKKKVHANLPENIIRINQSIKPHLHIVDAMICMEGLGPTRGTPIKMDMIIVGTDPYLIDLACAKIAMYDHKKVRTLDLAEKKGLLTPFHHNYVDSLVFEKEKKKFAPPMAGPLATFIHSPKRQSFFLKIRNTSFFSYLAATEWFGKLLFLTGLRQDVFLREEMELNHLSLDETKCDHCGLCRIVCPLGSDVPITIQNNNADCIGCLYCYSVCPTHAIVFDGEFGFFAEQMKQYDHLIRKLYQ